MTSGLSVFAQQVDSTSVLEENIITGESRGRDQNGALELEIGQLIIDNTFSKAGNDFQQIFNTSWNWPAENSEEFIITISEKPSFLNSTLVEVTVNDLKVFESFLQPRYDVLEDVAGQAIEVTLQYILNYAEVVRQLSGEDLAGSGIY